MKTNTSTKRGSNNKQVVEFTDEEIEEILGPSDVQVEMKCKTCGLEEEFLSKKDAHIEHLFETLV